MKQNSSKFARLGNIRNFFQRFAFISLISIFFAIMLIGKADTLIVNKVNSTLSDLFSPLISMMSAPASAVSQFVKNIEELADIRDQNARLREDNKNLMKWFSIASQLENENQQLKKLLNVVDEPEAEKVTARVVADTGGAFAQSVIITGGNKDGIQKGQAVVNDIGLIGRVTQVGNSSSRVLLINDINSRIPVRVGDAGYNAILAGNNSLRPSIIYLGLKRPVNLGDKVITSGDAGAFPPGLPIGKVVSVDKKNILVETFASRDGLQFVNVLKYKVLTDLRLD